MAIKQKRMFSRLKKEKNLAAKVIIAALLIANILAFIAGNNHFARQADKEFTEIQERKFDVLKSGWQLMNWSYSLLRHYRGTPAE